MITNEMKWIERCYLNINQFVLLVWSTYFVQVGSSLQQGRGPDRKNGHWVPQLSRYGCTPVRLTYQSCLYGRHILCRADLTFGREHIQKIWSICTVNKPNKFTHFCNSETSVEPINNCLWRMRSTTALQQ